MAQRKIIGKKWSRESIIQLLKNHSSSLGKQELSRAEIIRILPRTTVNRYFGSLRNACAAAGLRYPSPEEVRKKISLRSKERAIPDMELFISIAEVENDLGREPQSNDYVAWGRYSVTPLKTRFGTWPEVLRNFRNWKLSNPDWKKKLGVKRDATTFDKGEDRFEKTSPNISGRYSEDVSYDDQFASVSTSKVEPPLTLYGAPFNFRGLIHAPTNEQGVVFLFGMVCRELGFLVETVRQGFPDCEAKYLYEKKKNLWARARIEFEFKAANFRKDGHDPKKCDFIVCWINNWPDCPIEVIELRKEIKKLNPR